MKYIKREYIDGACKRVTGKMPEEIFEKQAQNRNSLIQSTKKLSGMMQTEFNAYGRMDWATVYGDEEDDWLCVRSKKNDKYGKPGPICHILNPEKWSPILKAAKMYR